MLVTKAEYARHRGVRPSAVSKWLARRQLTAPALSRDGLIDPSLADAQLRERLDPVRRIAARWSLKKPAADDRRSDDPLIALRVRRMQLEIENMERAAAIEQGNLMPAAEGQAAWARALAGLVEAIEQWLPSLVMKLGGDQAAIDRVVAEWRTLRRRLGR